MTDIINLRRARKQKARQARKAAGDSAAALHGEAKPVRDLRAARADLDSRRLDGARRETPPTDAPPK